MENLEPTLATLGARWDNAPRMGRHSIAKWHFNIPHSFKFIIANLPTGMFLANEKKQMNLEERIEPGNLELWSCESCDTTETKTAEQKCYYKENNLPCNTVS